MNRKGTNRRLDAVGQTIDVLPFHKQAIDHGYERLLTVGELPDDDRLAWTVLEQALYARRTTVDGRGIESRPQPAGSPIEGPPRRQVFREAVHLSEPARIAARGLIAILVAAGHDPTDAEFIPSDLEMPEFGGVAMHLLGWPDQWVSPPYEPQMQRVLRQHAEVRARHGRSDSWYRQAATALAAFLRQGRLPDDPTLRLFALTIGEMFALHAHFLGMGDTDLLTAYEAVATVAGVDRPAALARLGRLQARSEAGR